MDAYTSYCGFSYKILQCFSMPVTAFWYFALSLCYALATSKSNGSWKSSEWTSKTIKNKVPRPWTLNSSYYIRFKYLKLPLVVDIQQRRGCFLNIKLVKIENRHCNLTEFNSLQLCWTLEFVERNRRTSASRVAGVHHQACLGNILHLVRTKAFLGSFGALVDFLKMKYGNFENVTWVIVKQNPWNFGPHGLLYPIYRIHLISICQGHCCIFRWTCDFPKKTFWKGCLHYSYNRLFPSM